MSQKKSLNTSNKTPNDDRKKTASALKNYGLILGGALVLLVVLAFRISKTTNCNYQYRDDRQLHLNQTIKLEQVSSAHDLEQGLSHRPCIQDDQGMLFVFQKPDDYKFWMKDMKFAIDMVWLNKDREVLHVEPNVQPSSYPKNFSAGQPSLYVLELAAGQASRLNIQSNQTLQF